MWSSRGLSRGEGKGPVRPPVESILGHQEMIGVWGRVVSVAWLGEKVDWSRLKNE